MDPAKEGNHINVALKLLYNCNLLGKLWPVTLDNASDIWSTTIKLTDTLNIRWNVTDLITGIHTCCKSHVVNFTVSDYLNDVHEYAMQIRSLLQAMHASVKRRDIHKASQRQLGLTVPLPSLEVRKRWSSTFQIGNPYKVRTIESSTTPKS